MLPLSAERTRPLGTKTQLRSLELQQTTVSREPGGYLQETYHEVSVLSSGHFVVKDTRVGSADVGLEAAVEHADLTPVKVEGLDVLVADTGSKFGLLKRHTDGSHGRLRGQTGHA